MFSSSPDPEQHDPRRLLDRLHQVEHDAARRDQLLETLAKATGAITWTTGASDQALASGDPSPSSPIPPHVLSLFGIEDLTAADSEPMRAAAEAQRGKASDFQIDNGGACWHGHIDPVWGPSGSVIGTAGVAIPRSPTAGERSDPFAGDLSAGRTLLMRESRQAAIAAFGRRALEGDSIQSLMDEAVQLAARTLDVEFAKILERQPGSEALLLAAGTGWRDGLVGAALVDARSGSQGAYALQSREPVIVDDLAAETRFHGAELLLGHGVVSGVTVLIPGRQQPFGVLGAHSAHRHRFTWDDLHFLEAIAHVLGAAIERKRSELELEEQARELERSNAELRQFAYVASHDLREPLRSIASFAQFLDRRYHGRLDDEADQFIRYIVEGVNRMSALINDLLDYSRLINPRVDIFARVDLDQVLRAAIQNLHRTITDTGARILVESRLPAVRGDQTRLMQLFQNLISNAIKYRSERPPEVRLSVASEPGLWRFSVEDNGIGIERQYFERIFGVFRRLHGPEYPGTGIGLASCRKIVEMHGGRIWVESEPGLGSKFSFTLPK